MTELRQREPRVLCPGYLAWLRKQGCACGCKSPPPSQAAHVRSGSVLHGKRPTGGAEKPSDCWAVPLKHEHHMEQHDYGHEVGWWGAHGRDPFALAKRYYAQYLKETGSPDKFACLDGGPKPKRSPKIKSAGFRKPAAKQKWPKRGFES